MCGGVEVGGEPSAPFQCRQVTQSSNEESSQDATEDDWEEWEKGSETELDGGEYSPGAGPNLATPRPGVGVATWPKQTGRLSPWGSLQQGPP